MGEEVLQYIPGAHQDELTPGQCTIRSSREYGSARQWWLLWLCVTRTDNGKPETRHLPVSPRSGPQSHGPGWGTWGLQPIEDAPHEWQISPSIAMLERFKDESTGKNVDKEIWHQTPKIVGVPDDELWTQGGEPPPP